MINIIELKKKQLGILQNRIRELSRELGYDDGDGSARYLIAYAQTDDSDPTDSNSIANFHLKKGSKNPNTFLEYRDCCRKCAELERDIHYLSNPDIPKPLLHPFSREELDLIEKVASISDSHLKYYRIFPNKTELGKAYNDLKKTKFPSEEAAASYALKEKEAVRLEDGSYLGDYHLWYNCSPNIDESHKLSDFFFIDEEYYRNSQFNREELVQLIQAFVDVPPILEKCTLFDSLAEMGSAYRKTSDNAFSSDEEAGQELVNKNMALKLVSGRYLDRHAVNGG